MYKSRIVFGRNNKAWSLALALILILPNFLPFHLIQFAPPQKLAEAFDALSVQRCRTVSDIEKAADKITNEKHIPAGSLAYAAILNDLVQQRFYHGYSHFALNENWLAALSGYFIWYHFSAIVIPDDLLKYPMAACSQQSIIMMELLRRKEIAVRKVGFNHHFALEARFGNQ